MAAGDVAYLCDAANRYFRERIETVRRGPHASPAPTWREAPPANSARRGGDARSRARRKAPLLTVFGGDVTTSRLRAERAVSKLTPFYPMSPRWTAKAPLPGGDFAWDRFDNEVDEVRDRWRFLTEDQARRLVAAYGSRREGHPRRRQRAQRSRPGFWAGTDRRRSALSHGQGNGRVFRTTSCGGAPSSA